MYKISDAKMNRTEEIKGSKSASVSISKTMVLHNKVIAVTYKTVTSNIYFAHCNGWM